jgi:hypothetical protein
MKGKLLRQQPPRWGGRRGEEVGRLGLGHPAFAAGDVVPSLIEKPRERPRQMAEDRLVMFAFVRGVDTVDNIRIPGPAKSESERSERKIGRRLMLSGKRVIRCDGVVDELDALAEVVPFRSANRSAKKVIRLLHLLTNQAHHTWLR